MKQTWYIDLNSQVGFCCLLLWHCDMDVWINLFCHHWATQGDNKQHIDLLHCIKTMLLSSAPPADVCLQTCVYTFKRDLIWGESATGRLK